MCAAVHDLNPSVLNLFQAVENGSPQKAVPELRSAGL
jgi:hypothetical protein